MEEEGSSRSGWFQSHDSVIFSGKGVGVVQGQPQVPPPSPYRVRPKDLSSMEGQARISPSVEESRVGQRQRDRGQTFPDVRQSQLSLDLGVSTFLLFLPPTQSASLSHGVLMFRPSPLDPPPPLSF